MSDIHVNTDSMRQIANHFLQVCENLRAATLPELQTLTHQLEGDWHGVSRLHFDDLMQHWNQSAMAMMGWGEDIARHLHTIADQFDQVDKA